MLAVAAGLVMLLVVVVRLGQVVQAAVETELLATMEVMLMVLLVQPTGAAVEEVVNMQTIQISLLLLAARALLSSS
jgi:hypothetical protein